MELKEREVKKSNAKANIDVNDKLLDLLLWYQIEDSNHWIRFTELDIKMNENMLRDLYKDEPCKFFKKQHKKWKDDIEEIENIIQKKYREIEKELLIIEKMQGQITGVKDMYTGNISFYDLLTLLKCNKQPKEVEVTICKKKAVYYFAGEDGYILKNRKDQTIDFEFYLGDALADSQKLDKIIRIIK
ncbi:MAG: hypothetical protein IKF91_02455 [Bacilli bacterium]|nr:hypothetical protein [Bacilli bacterium]